MEQVKILIGVPDNRPMYAKPFIKSLFPILALSQQFFRYELSKGKEYSIDICWAERGDIDNMRNTIAKSAIEGGYEYIMWMDSDMTFPEDLILRMLSHFTQDETLEAVSGLYTYKTYPYMPHVYPKYDEADNTFFVGKSFPIERPFFVDGMGFGCVMMKTSVFQRLTKPFFTSVIQDGTLVVGEDLGFCIKAKMKAVLDPTIRCGHLHERAYGIADYLNAHGITPTEDGYIRLNKEQTESILGAMPKQLKIKTDE